MQVQDIDHLELTVNDLEQTMRFYHEVFDLPILFEGTTKIIFQLGKQKLVCKTPSDNGLQAKTPTVGSTTFSILAKDSLASLKNHLANYFIEIVAGPIESKLGKKQMTSIYINDPAGNLIEIREYHR